MDTISFQEARARLVSWVEEGVNVLALLPGLFADHERVVTALEVAQREGERLCQELGAERDQLAALRRDNETLRRERDEVAEVIAEGVTKLMNQALERLRAPI